MFLLKPQILKHQFEEYRFLLIFYSECLDFNNLYRSQNVSYLDPNPLIGNLQHEGVKIRVVSCQACCCGPSSSPVGRQPQCSWRLCRRAFCGQEQITVPTIQMYCVVWEQFLINLTFNNPMWLTATQVQPHGYLFCIVKPTFWNFFWISQATASKRLFDLLNQFVEQETED